MYFRPGEVYNPQEIEYCGKKPASLKGVKQKICPFLQNSLD